MKKSNQVDKKNASKKQTAKPIAKPDAKLIAKPVAKPIAKPTAKQVAESNGKQAKKSTVKPAAKPSGSGKAKAKGGMPALVGKEDAHQMIRLLLQKYPEAQCELTYKNDFELLTAVIMSAQTTDVQVNKVTPALFEHFPTAKALANADPEKVRELIKPTGFYINKAKSIQACAQALVQNHGGNVPNSLDELVELPGVGRKTANVILGVVHKIPSWTVDTHVQRLSHRLGLSHNEDPYKIELDLQKVFPDQDWSQISITLIFHGRRMCFARNPDCPSCPINHICPSSQV